MKQTQFDQSYYDAIMREFQYSPLEFESISFSLGKLKKEHLQKQWLCHVNGNKFAQALDSGKSVVATTGFGLSGVPHMGTFSQILRSLRLQQAGIPVQIVLGDLDAYNGKNISLDKTIRLADSYHKFILGLGFKEFGGSRLRSQYDSLSTLRTSYLIGRYMEDEMFNCVEEDLHMLYSDNGKVDSTMTYRRKLSLNLMVADFLELITTDGFQAILVVLGIDEHKYVAFGRKVFEKMISEQGGEISFCEYSSMYSGIIRGFNGYPKMSKSFPESGISVDMTPSEISKMIEDGEVVTEFPETNVVYQMISSVSLYDDAEIAEAYAECRKQSNTWRNIKSKYAMHLAEICSMWKDS